MLRSAYFFTSIWVVGKPNSLSRCGLEEEGFQGIRFTQMFSDARFLEQNGRPIGNGNRLGNTNFKRLYALGSSRRKAQRNRNENRRCEFRHTHIPIHASNFVSIASPTEE